MKKEELLTWQPHSDVAKPYPPRGAKPAGATATRSH
jgi:hypothetical protein